MLRALTLLTTFPGKADEVAAAVRAIAGVKEALVVAGRADVAVIVEGSLEEINGIMGRIGGIGSVDTMETLMEAVR